MQRTGLVTYYFLIWNLTLAGIPLAIAYLMNAWLKEYRRILLFYAMGALWLAFYPNAPYIITDFIHLKARHHIPLWFDTLLIFSFACRSCRPIPLRCQSGATPIEITSKRGES